MSEIRVGVRDLKTHLSEYLRQVRQGSTLIITDHGKPVGRLSPIQQSLEERLAALQIAGMVAWNGRKLHQLTPAAINRGARQVADLLVELRE
jgi:prevent-host-death family protein